MMMTIMMLGVTDSAEGGTGCFSCDSLQGDKILEVKEVFAPRVPVV